jgi:uncharacterized protein YndB with AHSA1/START domain
MSAANWQTVEGRVNTIVRVFDAPRDIVWAAWSDPEHIKHWWGPTGFTNTIEEFDFRSGGHWRFVMHGPDGTAYDNHNVFVEVVKPERIVIDHIVEPLFRIHVAFEAIGETTRMTFRQTFESIETFERVKPYAVPGAMQMFDRFVRHLERTKR